MKKDRRTLRTLEAIQSAFIALLEEKSLDKISVTELCQLANIGRGTFYLHYQDIYDLHEKIQDQLANQLMEIVQEQAIANNFSDYISLYQTTFTYLAEQERLVRQLVVSDGDLIAKIKARLLALLLATNPEDYEDELSLLEARFMIAGSMGLLEEELKSGCPLPSQEDLGRLSIHMGTILGRFEE